MAKSLNWNPLNTLEGSDSKGLLSLFNKSSLGEAVLGDQAGLCREMGTA
jgi:hypothetical protein